MNVATATAAAFQPRDFMRARSGTAAVEGASAGTPSIGAAEPLTGRYPTIAFTYDPEASRLVMLYRDPANGKTETQIPTEAALKRYKEAQKAEKDAQRDAFMMVGGGDRADAYGPRGAGSGSAVGRTGSAGAGTGISHGASPASPPVASSIPVTTVHMAASAIGHVNMMV
jgi:hypothetical protein